MLHSSFRPTQIILYVLFRDNEDKYWIGKKKKIQDLLGEQKFAVKGKEWLINYMVNDG